RSLAAFDLAFTGPDVAGLVPLLPWQVVEAARPLWQGGFAVRASGRTEPAGLALSAVVEALDARIEAAGTAGPDLRRFDGRLALRHPGAPRLLAALGLDDPTGWLGEGSAAVVLDLAAEGRRLTLRGAEIGLGGMRARGAGEVVLDPGGRRVALTVEAETLRLPPLDPRSAAPLPPGLFAGWTVAAVVRAGELSVGGAPWLTRLDGALEIADGALALSRLTAGLGGGALSAAGRYDPPAGRLALEATILDAVLAGPLFDLPFDLGAGRVSAELRLAASGRSAFALLGSLSGEARLTAREGILVGFDLLRAVEALQGGLPVGPAIAELRAALSEGATAFERAEALIRLERGLATLDQSQLVAAAGTAQVLGEVDLRGRGLDLAIALAPLGAEPLPPLGLRVTGPWAAPRRAVEAAAAARFLAERAQPPR
ncbi:MAG: AsmA-like C-terminal region-containing protein, partial [Acetobacteraceae bacterium]